MLLKNGKKKLKTTGSFRERIYTGKITIDEAEEGHSNLLENMVKFNNESRPKNKVCKKKKEIILIV